ncbi:O-methyltransferase [Apodospora peruviana]|uniref:O-methyltransferase n=1 Tax=Apodospora peruviana TaxID=516989 RepID=A0AAE0IPW7_9PEZI|nr:O-methyltransferase [Apodospora peruviana]
MAVTNGKNGTVAPPASTLREDLRKAIADLTAAVDDFVADPEAASRGGTATHAQRSAIAAVAARAQALVKEPSEQGPELCRQASIAASTRLFSEWGVFEAIPRDGSVTYTDLAAMVKVEEVLIIRISRVLISAGVLERVGTDKVAHTPNSRIFLDDNPAGHLYNLAWDNTFFTFPRLPQYFETYGRKEPQTLNHVPVTYAQGKPELAYYDMIAQSPAKTRTFMMAMSAMETSGPTAGVYDFSWVVSLLRSGHIAADRPVLVDVGGAKGHAIKAIVGEFPQLPLKRLILQDGPAVIESAVAMDEPELRGVKKMAVDFHAEQPVKGALLYFIRRCLHNYSDQVCINILKNLVDAMADDSKVLIMEDVIEDPPPEYVPFMDFVMLTFAGKQRTMSNWEKVISGAGLKISSISTAKGPWTISVMECVKAAAL